MWFSAYSLFVGLVLFQVAELATVELDGNKFLDRRSPSDAWLVVFYADWCGHCQKLMPIFDRVSARLRGTPIRTGKIESNRAGSASRHYQVNGYPSVVYVHGDTWHSFDGARTEEGLYKFALRSYGPALKFVDTAKRFEELIRLHDTDTFFVLFCDAESCIRHGITPLPATFANVSTIMQLRGDFYYGTRSVFTQLFNEELFNNAETLPEAGLNSVNNEKVIADGDSSELTDSSAGDEEEMEFERGAVPIKIAGRTRLVDRASCEPVLRKAVKNIDEVVIVVKDGAIFCFDEPAERERAAKNANVTADATTASEPGEKTDAEATGKEDDTENEKNSALEEKPDTEENELEALVGRWVNRERFVAFAAIGGVEVNELATTGKRLVLFVTLNATSLGDPQLDPARLNAYFHDTGRALSKRRATYHTKYQFAWLTDAETVHLMILARPSVPFMFVFDSATHYFYLNDTRQQQSTWRSKRDFASFITEVDEGLIVPRGGRGWLNRVARAFFDLYISFIDLLFGAPLVALLVLGLPLGVLSILVYALCCLDSDAQPAVDPDELEREFADYEGDDAEGDFEGDGDEGELPPEALDRGTEDLSTLRQRLGCADEQPEVSGAGPTDSRHEKSA